MTASLLNGPTAFLLTPEEVRRFESAAPTVGAIVALSPAAQAAVSQAWRDRLVEEPLSDCAHARIAARGERVRKAFLAALDAGPPLRPSTRQAIGYSFMLNAYLIARIWEILRVPGPWLVPQSDGWTLVSDREEAHRRLVEHFHPSTDRCRSVPMPWLFRPLRGLVLRLLRRRGPWLLSRTRDLVFGLDALIDAKEPALRRLVVARARRGLRAYLDLVATLRHGFSQRQDLQVALLFGDAPEVRKALAGALERISDGVVARGLTTKLRASIMAEAAECETAFKDALAVIRAIAPKAYAARQGSGQFAVVADAAGVLGVPRYIVNYNSYPDNDSRLARSVLDVFFDARLPLNLSDVYPLWSPHIAATAARVHGGRTKSKLLPMRLAPLNGGCVREVDGLRRIIVADTFTEYRYFIPCVLQTSSEYLRSVRALVESLEGLPDVELTLRAKNKGECSGDTLRSLIGERPGLRVTGVSRPFEEAVELSDLLVSFGSTTIEDAIRCRRPVLLWGPVQRYRHLPARALPPTANSRSAIYVANEEADLRPMIAAILDAHAGKPLTDDEIAAHIWPESVPGPERVADMIAEGARLP